MTQITLISQIHADDSLLWLGAAALKALIVAVIPAKAGTQTGQS